MQDELAIQNVLNTYSQSTSLGDWDATLGTFLPDAVWRIPHIDLKFEGREAIRAALTGLSSTMDFVLQLNSPAIIKVDGDTATASSGIREAGKTRGKDEGFEYFGLYLDTLERTDAGWKFRERVFKELGTLFTPLAPPPAK